MAITLHLDENVHATLADALRRRGIDVTTTVDAGLVGASDERHLEFGRNTGRVVITHDPDMLRLHTRGEQHAGIAFCHARKYSLRQLISVLSRFAVSVNAADMIGRIRYL